MRFRVAVYPTPLNTFNNGRQYEPQVWRWWWPFWRPLALSVESKFTRPVRCMSSEQAWGFIEGYTDQKPAPQVTYEYAPEWARKGEP